MRARHEPTRHFHPSNITDVDDATDASRDGSDDDEWDDDDTDAGIRRPSMQVRNERRVDERVEDGHTFTKAFFLNDHIRNGNERERVRRAMR